MPAARVPRPGPAASNSPPPAASAGDWPAAYSVIVTNTFGVATSTATLTVLPAPMFQSVTASGGAGGSGGIVLIWTAIPGQTYRLQYKDDLTSAAWVSVIRDIIATGGTISATNTAAGSMHRFYRVLLVP